MNTEAIPQGEGRYSQDRFALLRSLVLGIRAPYSPYGYGQIYPGITGLESRELKYLNLLNLKSSQKLKTS